MGERMSTQKKNKEEKSLNVKLGKKNHGKMNQSANKEDIFLNLLEEETVNGVL